MDDLGSSSVGLAGYPAPRKLEYPVKVMFIGHTADVPTEFKSALIAAQIAQIAKPHPEFKLELFSAAVADHADALMYLGQKVAQADGSPVLIVVHGYRGAATYTAVKSYLDTEFSGVEYRSLLIKRAGEVVDTYSHASYEVDDTDDRISAVRLALNIIDKNDPRRSKQDCGCGELSGWLAEVLAELRAA